MRARSPRPALEREREAKRRPRRVEDDQRLVAAQLLQRAPVLRRQLRDDAGERLSQRGARLVAVLARVRGVAADVGEQERANGPRLLGRRRAQGAPLAAQRRARRRHERPARRVAQVAILGQGRRDHVVEGFGQLGPPPGDFRRGIVDVRQERPEFVAATERRLARQQLVEHAAERVDVDAPVHRPALDLLGREVLDRPDDSAIARQARDGRRVLRQAEIAQIRVIGATVVVREQDVGGLDVTMDQASPMCGVERIAHLGDELDGALRVQPPEDLQQAREVAAVHIPHRQVEQPVGLARSVDRDDVGMLEARDEPRLAQEALAEPLVARQALREDLHGHSPVEREVFGRIHRSHRSAADQATDAEIAHRAGVSAVAGGTVMPREAARRVCLFDFRAFSRRRGHAPFAGFGAGARWPPRRGRIAGFSRRSLRVSTVVRGPRIG